LHGGARPWEYDLIDFSANLNPWHPEFPIENCHRYPYGEFDEIVSEFVGRECAVIGGITEAIYLSFLLKEGDVITMRHTYSEYARVAKIFGRSVHYVEGLNPQPEDFYIPKNGIVFLCNPNNPTGIMKDRDFVKTLADECCDRNSLLFLDEAYIDFSGMDFDLDEECVLRVRSFTKLFGLPGIRVGYVLSLVDEIKKIRMPWSIGCAGASFLKFLENHGREFLKETLPKIIEERERIGKILGLKSSANFFLLNVGDADSFCSFARKRGILVRNCKSFYLPQYIRFSVRRRWENDILLEAIGEWFDSNFQ